MNQNRLFEHITRNVLRRLTLNEEDSRVTKIKRDVIRDAFIRNGFKDEAIDVDKLYYNLRHDFGLMDNKDLPLIRFIAPIAYSDDVLFDIDDSKREEQSKLKEIARFLKAKNDYFNEIKNKVTSFKELCNEVEPCLQQKKRQEDDELANVSFVGGIDYDILEDVDFETANHYGNMSCSLGKLCYTQEEKLWDNYKEKGKNKCYLLLSKDWRNVEEKHTEPIYEFLPYNAYDEYGLSMVFVFVKPNNEIAYCNTRWNHHAEYGEASEDHALSKADLFQITGRTFGGYTEEEGFVLATIETAHELLDKGYDPKKILDEVSEFNDGFAKVRLDDKWNYINEDGKLISSQWFVHVSEFKDGFGPVRLENGWNYVNTNGDLLSNHRFDYAWRFYKGFGVVQLDGKQNFLDAEGELLSDQWFDDVSFFNNSYASVRLNGKRYKVDREGNIYR